MLIVNSERWTKIIEDWIEMVNIEKKNQLDSENYIGERPYDFEVGGHDIYPARNTLAKWKLPDLLMSL
jgi:hypothetical protein